MMTETALAEIEALRARRAEVDARLVELEVQARKELARKVLLFLESEGATVADALCGLKWLSAEKKTHKK